LTQDHWRAREKHRAAALLETLWAVRRALDDLEAVQRAMVAAGVSPAQRLPDDTRDLLGGIFRNVKQVQKAEVAK
jgi:transposase